MTGVLDRNIGLEPALTYQEVAIRLGVSKSYVQKQVSEGHLPSFREGRYMKVLESELQRWRTGQLERAESKRVGRSGRRELTKPVRRPVNTGKRDYSHIDQDIRERLKLK